MIRWYWYRRKSSQRALDELQRTIVDVEAKYKAEIGRLKKKHESDVREYEIQVETLNRNNAELSKANKSLATRVKVILTVAGLVVTNSFNKILD